MVQLDGLTKSRAKQKGRIIEKKSVLSLCDRAPPRRKRRGRDGVEVGVPARIYAFGYADKRWNTGSHLKIAK